MRASFMGAVVAAALLSGSAALADFTGQTILGPIGLGDTVNGNTTGATDDNDGFTSGDHFFFIWNGPDDVWQIDWAGGDLTLEMTYDNTQIDLDLFLYTPASYNDSGNYSTVNTGVETVLEPAAAAGIYYVVIDSENFSNAGPYTLSVTPEPTSLGLLGLGALMLVRRR